MIESKIDWRTVYMTILRDGGTPVLKTSDTSFLISPGAVRRLKFNSDEIEFIATFGGEPVQITVLAEDILGMDDIGEE